MALLEVKVRDEDQRIVACDQCRSHLYRVSSRALGIMPISTDPEKEGYKTIRPTCITVVLEIGDTRRMIFCSKACAKWWLDNQPEESLKGGYPLFW